MDRRNFLKAMGGVAMSSFLGVSPSVEAQKITKYEDIINPLPGENNFNKNNGIVRYKGNDFYTGAIPRDLSLESGRNQAFSSYVDGCFADKSLLNCEWVFNSEKIAKAIVETRKKLKQKLQEAKEEDADLYNGMFKDKEIMKNVTMKQKLEYELKSAIAVENAKHEWNDFIKSPINYVKSKNLL